MTRDPVLQMVVREAPIRWGAMISSMQTAGFSLRDIAGALALTHSTVQRWTEGTTPNYEDGKAFLRLWDTVRTLMPPTVIAAPN